MSTCPLISQVPYMRNLGRQQSVWGAPRGEPAYYRMAEMWFDDRAAFDKAMASDENRAAGKDLMSFARDDGDDDLRGTQEIGDLGPGSGATRGRSKRMAATPWQGRDPANLRLPRISSTARRTASPASLSTGPTCSTPSTGPTLREMQSRV